MAFALSFSFRGIPSGWGRTSKASKWLSTGTNLAENHKLPYEAASLAARSNLAFSINPEGNDVYEPQIRPPILNAQERSQLVQKAKADRLAFDTAELLSRGETGKAATLAAQCATLASQEEFAVLLRRYATAKFKIARKTVDDFLGDMPAAGVAL